ncbi:MAG: hypothetical protein V2I33_05025, partial [Kangiellaceae bacterium]|nr:hypothetical protein [Kangiellaceae bacterium]
MSETNIPLHYSAEFINPGILDYDLILVPSQRIKRVLLDSLGILNHEVLVAITIKSFDELVNDQLAEQYMLGKLQCHLAPKSVEQRVVKIWLQNNPDWQFLNIDAAV